PLPPRLLAPPPAPTAAATTAAAAPAPAESAAAATRLLWPRLVDRQRSPAEALFVELGDRILRILIGRHFHEREAARPAGLAIPHHVHGRDVAGFRKERREIVFIGVVREIANIQFVAHSALCASDRCSMGNAALGAGCSSFTGAGGCVARLAGRLLP